MWSTGRSDDDGPADAIVVMGAAQYDGRPSPQLAARLDHVVELWPQGPRAAGRRHRRQATRRPLHGGPGVGGLPGGARRAGRGRSCSRTRARTATSRCDAVAALLEARGLDEVLIVTDPYHALRSKLIAEQVGLTAHVSPTPSSVVQGRDALGRELREAAGVALGRLIGFEHI